MKSNRNSGFHLLVLMHLMWLNHQLSSLLVPIPKCNHLGVVIFLLIFGFRLAKSQETQTDVTSIGMVSVSTQSADDDSKPLGSWDLHSEWMSMMKKALAFSTSVDDKLLAHKLVDASKKIMKEGCVHFFQLILCTYFVFITVSNFFDTRSVLKVDRCLNKERRK